MPHHILKKKKKKKKRKRKRKHQKNMMGYGVVRPHPGRLSKGGGTTPNSPRGGLGGLGVAKPPLMAQGVVWPPLGPIAQNFVFGCLAQGEAEPPPRPLGVVRPPLDWPAWGWPNHPRPNGVADHHHLWGGSATQHIFFYFFFFFKKKKNVRGVFWE
jgi:hypothetical protein